MILTINIGNTYIHGALFKGERIAGRFSIPVKRYRFSAIRKCMGFSKADDVIICSVVPEMTRLVEGDICKVFHKRPFIVGKDVLVPIKNRYRQPGQLGQDRLVNVYAGSVFYGAPLIVADFGTAITFDVVSEKGEYLGGMIAPGLQISLDALSARTALLPRMKVGPPKEVLGRDTARCLSSGLVYGFAALTDGLLIKIRGKAGKNTRIIGTGGDAGLISRYCRMLKRVDPDLTLKGMFLLYRKISQKKS